MKDLKEKGLKLYENEKMLKRLIFKQKKKKKTLYNDTKIIYFVFLPTSKNKHFWLTTLQIIFRTMINFKFVFKSHNP